MMDIERTICLKLIEEILKLPFVTITVNDGEEDVLVESNDPEAITSVMYTTEMDILLMRRHDETIGWFHLIYGNGYDVLSDHKDTSLCHAMAEEVEKAVEELRRGNKKPA